jgi:hypothetical protein
MIDYHFAQLVVGFIIFCILFSSLPLIAIGAFYAIIFMSIVWIFTFAFAWAYTSLGYHFAQPYADVAIFILTLGGIFNY